uniref:Uncharacterized protein n=1 Tax=Plectus sambesii TaxID=2011161 RepID=A0A914VR77_9BILA
LAVSSPSGSSGGQRHDLTPLSGDTPSQIGSQNPLQTSVDSISEAGTFTPTSFSSSSPPKIVLLNRYSIVS